MNGQNEEMEANEFKENAESIRAIPCDELPDRVARAELVRRALAGHDVYAYIPAASRRFVVWVRQERPDIESRFVPMEWARLWHLGLQPDVIAAERHETRATRLKGWWTRRREIVRMLLMMTLTISLLVIILSGCDLGPGSVSAGTNSVQGTSVTPMPAVPHRGRLYIQIDPDITGSYPRSLLHEFLRQMGSWIGSLPQVNSEPDTIYITYLNHAPYLPASSPLSFTLNGVPDWPQLQTTPVPSCPNNPYVCSHAQETVTAHNSAATATYQQQLQEVQGQLQAANAKAQEYGQQVQSLNPGIDDKATSVYGVLNLASERFSGVTGDKWIVLGSDLGNNTSVDEIAPDLTGVHVLVDLYCTSAVSCSQTKVTWKAVFTRAHVASIAFLEPAESQTMLSPWGSQ